MYSLITILAIIWLIRMAIYSRLFQRLSIPFVLLVSSLATIVTLVLYLSWDKKHLQENLAQLKDGKCLIMLIVSIILSFLLGYLSNFAIKEALTPK